MQIILYAVPGFIFLILTEWLYGLARGRNTYRLADTITSISLGSISRLRCANPAAVFCVSGTGCLAPFRMNWQTSVVFTVCGPTRLY